VSSSLLIGRDRGYSERGEKKKRAEETEFPILTKATPHQGSPTRPSDWERRKGASTGGGFTDLMKGT